EDLVALATFLSGGNFASVDQSTGNSSKALEALWESLRAKNPQDFTTSEAQVVRWHEFRAEEAEIQGDWFAAKFHLKLLSAKRPQDASLSARLETARKHLQQGD